MDHVLITGFPKLLARRMALSCTRGARKVSLLVQESQASAAREFAQGAMEVLVGDASGHAPGALHLRVPPS